MPRHNYNLIKNIYKDIANQGVVLDYNNKLYRLRLAEDVYFANGKLHKTMDIHRLKRREVAVIDPYYITLVADEEIVSKCMTRYREADETIFIQIKLREKHVDDENDDPFANTNTETISILTPDGYWVYLISCKVSVC